MQASRSLRIDVVPKNFDIIRQIRYTIKAKLLKSQIFGYYIIVKLIKNVIQIPTELHSRLSLTGSAQAVGFVFTGAWER